MIMPYIFYWYPKLHGFCLKWRYADYGFLENFDPVGPWPAPTARRPLTPRPLLLASPLPLPPLLPRVLPLPKPPPPQQQQALPPPLRNPLTSNV
eukprot:Transcript_18463.p2 GENE.Transcript_18463~~Transcript_18463.p2  ORF type:complete len:94 (-),score=11.74 Transcript_18463:4-285(-)